MNDGIQTYSETILYHTLSEGHKNHPIVLKKDIQLLISWHYKQIEFRCKVRTNWTSNIPSNRKNLTFSRIFFQYFYRYIWILAVFSNFFSQQYELTTLRTKILKRMTKKFHCDNYFSFFFFIFRASCWNYVRFYAFISWHPKKPNLLWNFEQTAFYIISTP